MDKCTPEQMARYAPLLLMVSLALIIGGAAIMLYFGYEIYILITSPEKSVFLTYILQNLPAPTGDGYVFKALSDGKPSEITIPANFFAYGRYLFAFMIWSMVGGLLTNLISSGVTIFKVVTRITHENCNDKTKKENL